jgi:peptide/nickel transport system substrate-binding protein
MANATRGVRFAALLLLAAAACSNDPYPAADSDRKILYRAYSQAPKTLDPAIAYTTDDHEVTSPVYDTLLQYHYLERPYRLIPGLAEEIPSPRTLPDGRVAYTIRLRPDLVYAPDPCFELGASGARTRRIVADDVAFELMRLADPMVGSPVVSTFARVAGFTELGRRLTERREADPAFAKERIDRQYRAVGGIEGVRVLSEREVEIVLTEPFPQILYWFAMEFTTPIPWEAVAYYDGEDGRPFFAEHPVASGPFRVDRYDKRNHISLVKNESWYGVRHPEWRAPGATYPAEGSAADRAAGLLDPQAVGRPLPFVDRVELYLEKEPTSAFNKFLQGYYDQSRIIEERFDQIVPEGNLSPEMAALGVQLTKSIVPGVYYLGFNMDDRVVGSPNEQRGRLLRQAMSLAIDAREFIRIFMNNRGIVAETPLPLGLFGHDAALPNPFREPDLEKANELLRQAGYPGGIDPETGKPVRLTFDTADTTARGLLRYQFFVDAWRRLGLDVQIAATNYNQFQDKIRRGAYQIFFWGWIADYPDPENFLALLWGPLGKSKSGGENTANFANPEYDRLFVAMRDLPDGPERTDLIRRMVEIVEVERPWIELFYPEDYELFHGWLENVKPLGMSFSTLKYKDVDPLRRAELREAWNEPILWPAYALAALVVAAVVPGVVTYLRERQ